MRALVLIPIVLVSCGGKKDAGSSVGPSAQSTAAADALWAMAPDQAEVGLVVTPRGVQSIEAALRTVRSFIETLPEAKDVAEAMAHELPPELAMLKTLADLGLDHDRGFALFGTKDDKLVILPVGDRDKFVAAVHGTRGTDSDRLGKLTCKPAKDLYVCASSEGFSLGHGKATLRPQLDKLGARGDLEFAGAGAMFNNASIAVVGQVEPGGIVVRGTVAGLPPQVMASEAFQGAPTKFEGKLDRSGGFLWMGTKMLDNAPPQPLVPGVTARDLVRSLGNTISVMAPTAGNTLELRVHVADPKPWATLIEHCGDLAPTGLLAPKQQPGACRIVVPQNHAEYDIWVAGNELRFGDKAKSSDGHAEPMTALGRTIADGEWTVAMWGRGNLLMTLGLVPPIDSVVGQIPHLDTALRVGTLISELGFAMRAEGDKVTFIVGARTVWSNPDAVVARLLAIPMSDVLHGEGGSKLAAIAADAKDSPLAGDVAAGASGLMISAGVTGVLAALAIPAFIDYTKKSKRTEAALQLNRLAKNAKTYFIVNAAYPQGVAPLTPAKPCCPSKCSVTDSWMKNPVWSALDFQIDEPNLYQYRYTGDSPTHATAEAIGDLDCDGIAVTYKLELTAPNGNATAQITEPPPNSD